ncbi:hypothetical protein L2E82_03478 [Cichorium intybus]|uniref:Uncharacterized protein n=1 Tax=Cichorium intybus TaxID=13427 RepID=A0ACB9H4T5_CICIN|nr:hypothetical protein L2E82_03478 [Cichorium intybus]
MKNKRKNTNDKLILKPKDRLFRRSTKNTKPKPRKDLNLRLNLVMIRKRKPRNLKRALVEHIGGVNSSLPTTLWGYLVVEVVMKDLETQHGKEYKDILDKLTYYKSATMVIPKVNSKILRDTATIMELAIETIDSLLCSIWKVGDFLDKTVLDLGVDALSKNIHQCFLKITISSSSVETIFKEQAEEVDQVIPLQDQNLETPPYVQSSPKKTLGAPIKDKGKEKFI